MICKLFPTHDGRRGFCGLAGPFWVSLFACALVPSLVLASGEPAGEGGHGGAGAGDLLLPPNVWAILSFLVVLAILLKKLLPPIIDVMDRRATAIREALDAAEKAREEKAALLASHEKEVKRARDEALAIVEEGKADALQAKDSIIAAARSEAEEMTHRARREIEQAKQAAIDGLQRRAVDLAFDIAGRLVEKSLDPEEHQKLIQERLKELPNA